MKLALAFAAITLAAVAAPHPSSSTSPALPVACNFGRGQAISDASNWPDQFRCYRDDTRKVSVPGTAFEGSATSGGACVIGVGHDRVQIGACNAAASDVGLTVPYSSIIYVIDDPRREWADIIVRR